MTVSKRGITLKLILFGLIMFLVCSATALFLRNKMNLPYDYGASLMARHSIFYMSGMLLKIYIGEIKELCIRYWLGFGVVWLVLATYWEFDHKPTFVTAPNMLVEMAYYYITAYVGILMMISICFRFVKQEGNGFILKMITSIGQKTLGIYAIHMSFLLQVAWDWVKQFQMNYWVSLCSVFLISVLGAVVLTSLFERGNIAPLLFLGKVRLNKKG